jgi:deoxycytidine triphosphate deaminase
MRELLQAELWLRWRPWFSRRRAVLKVRSREVRFILERGQIVGCWCMSMLARSDTLYGQGIGSNYQAQSLKLSKHFRGRGGDA